jgi:FHA domain
MIQGMMPSDLTEWQAQKKQLTRDAFGKKYAFPFLVRRASTRKDGDPDSGDYNPIGFHTNVSDGPQAPEPATGSMRLAGATVLPVIKKPQNPYPERISIGRALNCDVVIRDNTVSKLHGHFRPVSALEADLVDRGSQNGTKVNGAPLKPEQPRRLAVGDIIIFGSVAVQFIDAKRLWDLL